MYKSLKQKKSLVLTELNSFDYRHTRGKQLCVKTCDSLMNAMTYSVLCFLKVHGESSETKNFEEEKR